jgi:hypothetical protein
MSFCNHGRFRQQVRFLQRQFLQDGELPPAKPNCVGLIFVVSGGWFSSHEAINTGFMQPFLDRG